MRVDLARTIASRPRNLVLDEPSRGLDLDGLRRLREILERLRREGVCIVLSSHVLSDVERLADRVFLLTRGEVLFRGRPLH